MKFALYSHRGHLHRQSGSRAGGYCSGVAGAVGHDQLRLRRQGHLWQHLCRVDVCESAGNRQNTAGNGGDLCGAAPESFNIKNFAPTNLGAFLNPLETNKALYALATSLDAMTIWSLVLLGIGTATVAGVKRTSGYIAVFGWWALCCYQRGLGGHLRVMNDSRSPMQRARIRMMRALCRFDKTNS